MKSKVYHRKWNLKINPLLHPHTQNFLAAFAMLLDAVTLYQAFEIGMKNSAKIVVFTIVGIIWAIDGIMFVLGNVLTYKKSRMIAMFLALTACVGVLFWCTWQTRSASAEVQTVSDMKKPDQDKHWDEYKKYAQRKENADSAFNRNMQRSLQMVTVCSTLFLLFLTYRGSEEKRLWADVKHYRALENQEYALEQRLMEIKNQPTVQSQFALSKAEAKAKILQIDTENRAWIDQQKLRIAASTEDPRAVDFSFHNRCKHKQKNQKEEQT